MSGLGAPTISASLGKSYFVPLKLIMVPVQPINLIAPWIMCAPR